MPLATLSQQPARKNTATHQGIGLRGLRTVTLTERRSTYPQPHTQLGVEKFLENGLIRVGDGDGGGDGGLDDFVVIKEHR